MRHVVRLTHDLAEQKAVGQDVGLWLSDQRQALKNRVKGLDVLNREHTAAALAEQREQRPELLQTIRAEQLSLSLDAHAAPARILYGTARIGRVQLIDLLFALKGQLPRIVPPCHSFESHGNQLHRATTSSSSSKRRL